MNSAEEQIMAFGLASSLESLDHTVSFDEAAKLTQKFTWREFCDILHEYNCLHRETVNKPGYPRIAAVIVYSQESFNQEYSVRSRSYLVFSDSKYFCWWMGGSSLPGYCLDGTDQGVNLNAYDWEIEYCYFVEGQGL